MCVWGGGGGGGGNGGLGEPATRRREDGLPAGLGRVGYLQGGLVACRGRMGCLQGGKVACREDGLPAGREGCLQ